MEGQRLSASTLEVGRTPVFMAGPTRKAGEEHLLPEQQRRVEEAMDEVKGQMQQSLQDASTRQPSTIAGCRQQRGMPLKSPFYMFE